MFAWRQQLKFVTCFVHLTDLRASRGKEVPTASRLTTVIALYDLIRHFLEHPICFLDTALNLGVIVTHCSNSSKNFLLD